MAKKKKGRVACRYDNTVMDWRLDDNQTVPAIEQSIITVFKFPVLYFQHFQYSPEAMALRDEDIKRLGWDNDSFDLPCPPIKIGEFSLLKSAMKAANDSLIHAGRVIERITPSMIKITSEYNERMDYCVLFFNHEAYEFYHLLFILGKDSVSFKNIPNPKIDTFSQLFKWVRTFEFKRQKLYKENNFTWKPKSELVKIEEKPKKDVHVIEVLT